MLCSDVLSSTGKKTPGWMAVYDFHLPLLKRYSLLGLDAGALGVRCLAVLWS